MKEACERMGQSRERKGKIIHESPKTEGKERRGSAANF